MAAHDHPSDQGWSAYSMSGQLGIYDLACDRGESQSLTRLTHATVATVVLHVYLADGFNRMIGPEWQDLWASYVDDCMVFGESEVQVKLKQRILSAALRAMRKRVSEKVNRTPRQRGHIMRNKCGELNIFHYYLLIPLLQNLSTLSLKTSNIRSHMFSR